MGKLLLSIWFFLGSLFGINLLSSHPTKLPNKLVVTRPEDKTDHISALTVNITNETKVRKLFEDIYLLPRAIASN